MILLDVLLPDVRGIGTLDSLLLAVPHVPILVFSDPGDEGLAKQAVQRGAQDYLLKDHLDGYTLPRALRNAIDRKAAEDALFLERERAQVTLDAIGDAVLCTDSAGNVTYLNSVAEKMTGWSRDEARGRPIAEVFRIVDGRTREPLARNPTTLAIEHDKPVGPAANSVLIRRDGRESAIEDSAAPIHGRDGSVIGAVMVFHDVSESRAVTGEMSHLAQHDFLTDLPNPVLLNDRISLAITQARRERTRLAVLFIDLDHFKDVNDSLGHASGDRLLRGVAERLQACVRGSDAGSSRKGGDEFVGPARRHRAPGTDAARTADKIICGRWRRRIEVAGPRRCIVTASIGISHLPARRRGCADPAQDRRRGDVPGQEMRSQQLLVLRAGHEPWCRGAALTSGSGASRPIRRASRTPLSLAVTARSAFRIPSADPVEV